jgi:hypothetical protein
LNEVNGKGQGLKPWCSIDLIGMTEVMPFYKTAFEVFSSSCEVMPFHKAAFEGIFPQAVKLCPFTRPLLSGLFIKLKATSSVGCLQLVLFQASLEGRPGW